MWNTLRSNWLFVLLIVTAIVVTLVALMNALRSSDPVVLSKTISDSVWVPPSLFSDQKLEGEERKLVIYGEDLIANTARYFGPLGSVERTSNGMNCQNCHLNAGRKNWGNNYSAVNSTYPRFRERSGTIETIYKRVSDCFERSLNGRAPSMDSREYQAIEAYIKWVGKDVKKGEKPIGSGIARLPFMERAADPANGQKVYTALCQTCHGENGEGKLNLHLVTYEYPPLWGEHSYNIGAGLFRLSNFAGYIKSNMPFNQATHNDPKLTNEEAWDVAAFVNSQPRPQMDLSGDWPNVAKKPFDHPFGPYTDIFTETQHKFGPYGPIVAKQGK